MTTSCASCSRRCWITPISICCGGCKIASQLSDEAIELITDLPRLAGSNAWAVAPSRSATGTALLASDPHLEVNRLPAIWYEAVLRWGDQLRAGGDAARLPAVCRRPHRASWLGA